MMGITTQLDGIPAEGLGGLRLGVSPLEMANAYATLASYGIHNEPIAITKVEFPDGKTDDLGEPRRKRVLPEWVAYEATKILNQNVLSAPAPPRTSAATPPARRARPTTSPTRGSSASRRTSPTSVWVGYPDARVEMYQRPRHQRGGRHVPGADLALLHDDRRQRASASRSRVSDESPEFTPVLRRVRLDRHELGHELRLDLHVHRARADGAGRRLRRRRELQRRLRPAPLRVAAAGRAGVARSGAGHRRRRRRPRPAMGRATATDGKRLERPRRARGADRALSSLYVALAALPGGRRLESRPRDRRRVARLAARAVPRRRRGLDRRPARRPALLLRALAGARALGRRRDARGRPRPGARHRGARCDARDLPAGAAAPVAGRLLVHRLRAPRRRARPEPVRARTCRCRRRRRLSVRRLEDRHLRVRPALHAR